MLVISRCGLKPCQPFPTHAAHTNNAEYLLPMFLSKNHSLCAFRSRLDPPNIIRQPAHGVMVMLPDRTMDGLTGKRDADCYALG